MSTLRVKPMAVPVGRPSTDAGSLDMPIVPVQAKADKLAALRVAVGLGIADIEAGRYTDFTDANSLSTHIQGIRQRVWAKRP
jgi:hypothetical protein